VSVPYFVVALKLYDKSAISETVLPVGL
jgi:hypothetical protein